jgi:hypothetical protein
MLAFSNDFFFVLIRKSGIKTEQMKIEFSELQSFPWSHPRSFELTRESQLQRPIITQTWKVTET